MNRFKVQEVLLLLEMTQAEFLKDVSPLLKAAKPITAIKIIDSIKGVPDELMEEFRDAYEAWLHGGYYDVAGHFYNVLDKFSDSELDELFEKFTSSEAVPDRVDKKLFDQLYNEIIKRCNKLTEDERQYILSDTSNLYKDLEDLPGSYVQHVRDFFYDAIVQSESSRYLFSEILSDLSQLPTKKANDAFIAFVNDAENVLQKIDVIRKSAITWNRDDDIAAFYELTKLITSDEIKSLATDELHKISSEQAKIFVSGLDDRNTYEKLFTKRFKSRSTSDMFLNRVSGAINTALKLNQKVTDYDLSPTEEKMFLDVVNIFKMMIEMGRDIVNEFNISFYDLGESFRNSISKLPETFTDEYFNTLLRNFKLAAVKQDINHGAIARINKQVKEAVKTVENINDPFFLETMDSLKELSHMIDKSSNKVLTDINDILLRVLGPTDNSYSSWATIFSDMINTTHVAELSFYKLKEAYRIWEVTPEEKRLTLIERTREALDPYIKRFLEKSEKLKAANPPEENEDDVLNQYAFAPARGRDHPYEKNNKKEAKLYTALQQHFTNNVPVSPAIAAEIYEILKSNKYQTVFKEPEQEFVYRGMSVKPEYVKKVLGVNQIDSSGVHEASFTWTPLEGRGVTSWTIEKNRAIAFANDNAKEGNLQVLLEAAIVDNVNKFVQGPDGLYNVTGFDSYKSEKEAIGLGPIKVSKIYWSEGHVRP